MAYYSGWTNKRSSLVRRYLKERMLECALALAYDQYYKKIIAVTKKYNNYSIS